MALGEAYLSNSHRRTSGSSRDESAVTKKEVTRTQLSKILALGFLSLLICSCGSSRKVVIQQKKSKPPTEVVAKVSKTTPSGKEKKSLSNREKIEQYINQFGPVAKAEMKAYGIPASITLAQGILESGMGYGRLAIEGNNHFGIKCHKEWNGKRIYHDDDRKGECFRVYKNPANSYRDHSLFLRDRSRYAFLFDIKTSNYKAWAKGLKKAGYATDPNYPDKLISLIERFDLTRFDNKKRKASKEEIHISIKNLIHTVKKGDTLYSLSKYYKITLEELIEINQISDQTIYLGQELKIPAKN